jgi:hypothetical protein
VSADRDRRKEDAERKILATMPMAGADAELAGEHSLGETAKELRDTAGDKPAQQIAALGVASWRRFSWRLAGRTSTRLGDHFGTSTDPDGVTVRPSMTQTELRDSDVPNQVSDFIGTACPDRTGDL